MSGNYLLDTNIVIAIFANDPSVVKMVQQADQVFIPVVAIGELIFGARKSSRVQENLIRIEGFVARNSILDCDSETAQTYGMIKDHLHKKGRPIPENDIWIGAIASQHNLTLVTRDEHFQEIADLTIETW